ncbi:Hsp70 family protein [Plantactinospora sp. WMMB334]|uniref:Hsp70 family protein n=1 Tax=Plantactinospora sp. WMMB334 TaxID=3404119 RepID=UPI003B930527
MYALGIDLGTTFTAAATWRDGRAETVTLGDRSAAIPSVVLLRQDETFLTGDAAHRRGFSEPQRVAREFKRRLGDTTPILLGGVPQSAEALMARLLRWVVDEVARREGGQPASICISHPANWGPYKMDLLRQAARMANLDLPVTFTTEPEAAAVNYTQQQRVEQDTVVAVYDLGGGTFDAAVLRKTGAGFEVMGQPEGIERLGGIDFDAAVFSHVQAALAGKLEELDEDDPAAINAVARLRDECVQAKEALSSDTDTSIPVLLPNVSTEVRLTRAELETMIRPALHGSVEALQRAIRSAGLTPQQVHSVLLVGGSSRMPIVAQMVGSELGRPVVVDAHPKHSIALGAAWLASGGLTMPAGRPVHPVPASDQVAAPTPHGRPAAAAVPAAGVYRSEPAPQQPANAPAPTAQMPAAVPEPRTGLDGASTTAARKWPPTGTGSAPVPGSHGTEPIARSASVPAASVPAAPGKRRTRGPVLVAAAVAVLLAAGGTAWALTGRGDGDRDQDAVAAAQQDGAGADQQQQEGAQGDGADQDVAVVPPDEDCTEVKKSTRWVCITRATVQDGVFTVYFDAEWAGSKPDIQNGFHLHLYGGDGTNPDEATMGSQASSHGSYYFDDEQPSVRRTSSRDFKESIRDAQKVCARIAKNGHELAKASDGSYHTGNCLPIERH